MDASIIYGQHDPALTGLYQAVEREKARAQFFTSLMHSMGDHETWQGYCDGSAHPGLRRAGVGGFLVSPAGEITGEFAELRSTGDAYIAEWQAVERLLERARAAGIRKLVVHTDNQGIAMACEGGFKNRQRTKLKSDIAQWRPSFDFLQFVWIPRTKNILADWLSRFAPTHAGHAICQPVRNEPFHGLPCYCASAMPRVCPSIQWEPGCSPVPSPAVRETPAPLNILGLPWCDQLRDFAARVKGRVPDVIEMEPWMLEAAALSGQRKVAQHVAANTGQAYAQVLERMLRKDMAQQPFLAWIRQRLKMRFTQLATAGQLAVAPPAATREYRHQASAQTGIEHLQQLRAERARSVQVEIYSDGRFLATSSDGHTQYQVDTIRGTCSCPDFQKRGHYLRCKHLVVAQDLAARLGGEVGAEAA